MEFEQSCVRNDKEPDKVSCANDRADSVTVCVIAVNRDSRLPSIDHRAIRLRPVLALVTSYH